MPEYLAPGVYVEEVSFRSKSIEGRSTSTAAFVGPTCYGPVGGDPVFVTNLAEFTRIFGGLDLLQFDGADTDNYLAHGVRAFFEEGGQRLYIARVFNDGNGDGRASVTPASPPEVVITARFPGRCGNMRLTFTPQISDNLLINDPLNLQPAIRRIKEHDTVLVISGSPESGELFDVQRDTADDSLILSNASTSNLRLSPGDQSIHLLTINVTIELPIYLPTTSRQYKEPEELEGFALHPQHPNSLTAYFTDEPKARIQALTVPFSIDSEALVDTGYEMADALLGNAVINALVGDTASDDDRRRVIRLEGGSDGPVPTAQDYAGRSIGTLKTGLLSLEDIDNISIVAAPGYSANYLDNTARVETIQAHLINHCHKMRYRIAVLDSPEKAALASIREYRSKIDSTHAALYYPWVKILDPATNQEKAMPPSGHVAGIYARNDVNRGVHKAPANEVVRLAIGFEFILNKAQQDILNPDGINCFRFFPGRGYRLWGARTISSDPEWKYVSDRRYFAYLESSIDFGTQWAVFEPNGPQLWGNVRSAVESFLQNEWANGRLLGNSEQEAFFVRCDRTTMTQNDLDNGRLVCLIGVAIIRPAEFVIFRIGQFTASSNQA